MQKTGEGPGLVERIAAEIGRAATAEIGRAAESIRHELVDRAWFGRNFPEAASPAPEQPAASVEQKEETKPAQPGEGDVLGRTMPEQERPSTLDEREATATAYGRHQQAGPFGLMELEDVQTRSQSGFEQWAGIGPAETGREHEPPAMEIER